MKVVIIEDETVAAQNIQRILYEINSNIEILAILKSVNKAVEWLRENLWKADLLFMDIKLTDGLSFEIFQKVELNKPIIFTTAFDEYAIRAFKVNSIDYLLKPINKIDLAAALQKWESLQIKPSISIDYRGLAKQIQLQEKQYKTRFLVKSGGHLKPIALNKIAYFTAEGNLVLLRTNQSRSYAVNYSLDTLEQCLDPKLFFRATRNAIIHIQSIEKVSSYFKGRLVIEVQPNFSNKLIVSSKKASLFKEWLDQ